MGGQPALTDRSASAAFLSVFAHFLHALIHLWYVSIFALFLFSDHFCATVKYCHINYMI